MASKQYAKVNQDRCVACGACRPKCPKAAIKIWRGCYAEVDPEVCAGCGKCARICPSGCISMVDRGEAQDE